MKMTIFSILLIVFFFKINIFQNLTFLSILVLGMFESNRLTSYILIKLLSNLNQIVHFEKIKKNQEVTGLKFLKWGSLSSTLLKFVKNLTCVIY